MPQRPSRVSPINLRGSSVLMHDPSPGPRKWAENGYRRSLFPSCGLFAGEVETDPDWSWGYRRWMEGQTLQEQDRICFIQREVWSGLTLMLEGLLSICAGLYKLPVRVHTQTQEWECRWCAPDTQSCQHCRAACSHRGNNMSSALQTFFIRTARTKHCVYICDTPWAVKHTHKLTFKIKSSDQESLKGVVGNKQNKKC